MCSSNQRPLQAIQYILGDSPKVRSIELSSKYEYFIYLAKYLISFMYFQPIF